MKLFFSVATTTATLLLSLSSFVDVVDAQGGRPDWAGQGNNKGNGNGGGGQGQGQGRPNGGGGQGGLFKGFGNNNKNNGNKFGFKNIGNLLEGELGKLNCAELKGEYEELNPETTTMSQREANKKRKGIRLLQCLRKCSDTDAEVTCEEDFEQNLCDRIVMQAEKAQKKAAKFNARADKGNAPERVKTRFAAKANRMNEMKVQLSGQLEQLEDAEFCIDTSSPAGN